MKSKYRKIEIFFSRHRNYFFRVFDIPREDRLRVESFIKIGQEVPEFWKWDTQTDRQTYFIIGKNVEAKKQKNSSGLAMLKTGETLIEITKKIDDLITY